jgi:5'-3' exonuclease
MGIPSYFRIVVKNYNGVLQNTNKYKRVNRLFLDLNCAIHPCCREITEIAKEENVAPKETDMIANVLLKINELVTLTNPRMLYIAVDGVAPLAKINQQRQRRYKSALEKPVWNTSAISPGTVFMNKLNVALDNYKHIGIEIIVNNSDNSGEGEHKIMHYINTTEKETMDPDVIYGLDADLIMLGLIAKHNNILLLREKTEYHIESSVIETEGDYLYLNINNTKRGIIQEMNKVYKQQYIDDYVFICFMLGNDFLKPIPSLQIRYNGMEILMDSYYKCSKGNPYFQLIKEGEIMDENLKMFLSNIADQEDDNINKIVNIRNKQRRSMYHRVKGNQAQIEENAPLLNNPDEYKIRFGEKDWRKRYILHGFNNSFDFSLNPIKNFELVENTFSLTKQYYTGLTWCTSYYFKGYKSVSNLWYYPYNFSPDLQTLLETKFEKENVSYTPALEHHEALLAMMPKTSKELLDPEYRKYMEDDSPLSFYYPDTFKEYSVLKRYQWECVPLLPKINVKLMRKIIAKT